MHAFDFVITLYSFVYALALAQILSTVGDMIRAGKWLTSLLHGRPSRVQQVAIEKTTLAKLH
jgi:hypothetical protein